MCFSVWHRWSCNTSFCRLSRSGSPFLGLYFDYRVKVKVIIKVKGQTKNLMSHNHLYYMKSEPQTSDKQ